MNVVLLAFSTLRSTEFSLTLFCKLQQLYSQVFFVNSIPFIWSPKILNPSWPTSGSRQPQSPPRWSCKSSRQSRTLLERTEQCSLKYSILFSTFSTHLGAFLVCFLGFLADHQLTILHVKILVGNYISNSRPHLQSSESGHMWITWTISSIHL